LANPDLLDSDQKTAHIVAAQASPCDELVIRTQPTAVDRPCRRKRLALAATILGSSMAFIDGSVVNVALPAIQSELRASLAALIGIGTLADRSTMGGDAHVRDWHNARSRETG
jgi:hypothetical protein